MYYISTRDSGLRYSASQAIVQGLSRDGGLFLPSEIPQIHASDIAALSSMSYAQRAAFIMNLYLDEFTNEELETYANLAYGENKFDHASIAPVSSIDKDRYMLELWHGPTCAFKDMALQMLPYLLTASLKKTGESRTVCILVATSGDTGKAALEGFCDVPGTKILVFFPRDGVSDIQKLQMITQSGSNVGVCSVLGNFDDAQNGVKQIFSDTEIRETLDRRGYFLSSANSINWGRVLPQIVYYISAYCDLVARGDITPGEKMNFSVPTGNFGNILAGWYAKQMGLPIGRLICASNENNVLTEFIQTGKYNRLRPFRTTSSPSMDILISSNLERLLFNLYQSDKTVSGLMKDLSEVGCYKIDHDILDHIQNEFYAGWCTDRDSKKAIEKLYDDREYLMDTHTAVAWTVSEQYYRETGDSCKTVIVSTASPFKFCSSVLDAFHISDQLPGTEIIDQLASVTNTQAPKPLASLSEKNIRFTQCTPKEDMGNIVREFLT